jgi:hypothetical protein
VGDEIEERSLVPHFNVTTWEEIYPGWKNDRLKYYWKSRELRFSPWDASLMKDKEKIC